MGFTLKDIEERLKKGTIRGFVDKGATDNSASKKSKYGNKKYVVDDIEFDSVKEAKRYVELRFMLKAGHIKYLERQVEFELNEGGTHSLIYKADFVYGTKDGKMIVEDVKGFRTREYKKKRRLMLEVHGIEIREV